MAAKGGVGKIAGAKEMYSLVRGMSINEIEESVKEPPQILVVSRDPGVEDLVAVVTGVRGTPSLTYVSPDKLPKSFDLYTLVIVHNPESNADFLSDERHLKVIIDALENDFEEGQHYFSLP